MTTFGLKRVKIWRHMPHSNAKNSYPWGGGGEGKGESSGNRQIGSLLDHFL